MTSKSKGSGQKTMTAGHQAKMLLKNIIRHTDAHNRLLEEADMWNLHTKMKDGVIDVDKAQHSRERHTGEEKNRESNLPDRTDVKKSFLYDDRENISHVPGVRKEWKRPIGLAHMDNRDDMKRAKVVEAEAGGTFWMKKLYEAEEGDKDRWGHSGYKELYPRDFQSGKTSADNTNNSRKSRRVKKPSSKKTSRNIRRDKISSCAKNKTRKRSRKSSSYCSSSGSESSSSSSSCSSSSSGGSSSSASISCSSSSSSSSGCSRNCDCSCSGCDSERSTSFSSSSPVKKKKKSSVSARMRDKARKKKKKKKKSEDKKSARKDSGDESEEEEEETRRRKKRKRRKEGKADKKGKKVVKLKKKSLHKKKRRK